MDMFGSYLKLRFTLKKVDDGDDGDDADDEDDEYSVVTSGVKQLKC